VRNQAGLGTREGEALPQGENGEGPEDGSSCLPCDQLTRLASQASERERLTSTGGFSEALSALLGQDAPGLSASTVVRLEQVLEAECKGWSRRDLADKEYVYIWVDGIHFTIRLEEHRQCILMVMGAAADGKKEPIAVQDGYRESEQAWKELLRLARRVPGDGLQARSSRRAQVAETERIQAARRLA
jgi:hypothetical protein